MTITKTSYRDGSASALLAYIGREGNTIKDRSGRELSIGEQADFIEQSEGYGFEREIIVAPERGADLSERELELRTRQTIREQFADAPSVRYVYAVHQDTEHPHAHVVLTGEREDLYMDRDDLEVLPERAAEHFREDERAAERDSEVEPTHDSSLEPAPAFEPEPER